MPIAREDIVYAYRNFLGRDPSSDECETWSATPTLTALRQAFVTSEEFQSILGSLGITPQVRLPQILPPLQIEWQVDPVMEATLLDQVTATWTALGHDRPHWSVLSSDTFLPENMQANANLFYESGVSDVALIVNILDRHGLKPANLPYLVEYGCGVGRVTPHLAAIFAQVTGVDISASHLKMAKQEVSRRGCQNVDLRLARAPEFGMTEPFDLWFSYIVLQHNPPPIIAMVLRRAFEMLFPGGLAIFQVPAYTRGYKFNLAEYLVKPSAVGEIEMHCIPQPVIFRLAREAGLDILEVREDLAMGPPSAWLSNTFVFRKRGSHE
jgi:SAM-dependent methyltransferase